MINVYINHAQDVREGRQQDVIATTPEGQPKPEWSTALLVLPLHNIYQLLLTTAGNKNIVIDDDLIREHQELEKM